VISKKYRQIVYARDDERCVSCGTNQNLTIHHRVNRGAGGSKLFNGLAYLLLVCTYCNSLFESSADEQERAKELGYKLSRNQSPQPDPTQIPVWYSYKSQFFYLDNEGNKR